MVRLKTIVGLSSCEIKYLKHILRFIQLDAIYLSDIYLIFTIS